MSHDIFSFIEYSVKKIAKQNMVAEEYETFIRTIRTSKIIKIGPNNISLHDYMMQHANDIANWASNNQFQNMEDHVDKKKREAVDKIKQLFNWV